MAYTNTLLAGGSTFCEPHHMGKSCCGPHAHILFLIIIHSNLMSRLYSITQQYIFFLNFTIVNNK